MIRIKIIILFLIIVFSFWFSACAFAATFYVDSSAIDDSGNGSQANPKKYINSGVNLLSGGDTLIIKDGIYTDDRDRIKNPPSGNSNSFTTIKAENDFGVVLSNLNAGTSVANFDAVVNLYQKSYVTIEGLIIKDCQGASIYTLSAVQVTESDHCKLKKIGIKNGVHSGANYGGGLASSNSNYCLFENIFVTGMMRYGINVGGGLQHHNILRRAVVRWDYANQQQPRAAIAVYGANQGQPPCENILIQNSLVIDGNDGGGLTFTGGFSAPHETSNIHRYGCISLNNRGYGFHSAEDSLTHDNTNTQCVVWDSDSGMWWRHLASGTSGAYRSTFEQTCPVGSTDPGRGATYECEANDNVFIGCTPSDVTLSGNVSRSVGDFQYITRSPDSDKGATIEKRMGTDGTLWGETGYDALTSENLWPWPYEDNIRALFSETNDPPEGYSLIPSINNARRGFCADGNGLYGGPITLTSYIWEYIGNPCPEDICNYGGEFDPTPPASPHGLAVL